MELTLKLDIPPLQQPITYHDKLLLTGSCFTEHISDRLLQYKFKVLSNPNGILFNPLSVADSLESYIDARSYSTADLFYLNELWNSWDHHTRFSDIDKDAALNKINSAQQAAAQMVKNAGWVVITLGSSFQYYLKESGRPVANNHRAPAQWFEKRLLTVNDIVAALSAALSKLHAVNPGVRVLFTISPVRHIRDGVIANNRSKGRLIEAVHTLCEMHSFCHYFPAYELVIDVLRDYRFFDVDFVHPNFMATTCVWEQFAAACIHKDALQVMDKVLEITTAARHRPRFPQTVAHRNFIDATIAKCVQLTEKYPYIDLSGELQSFNNL
jgi:hypothetical protein